jgi:hypothetical protein
MPSSFHEMKLIALMSLLYFTHTVAIWAKHIGQGGKGKEGNQTIDFSLKGDYGIV